MFRKIIQLLKKLFSGREVHEVNEVSQNEKDVMIEDFYIEYIKESEGISEGVKNENGMEEKIISKTQQMVNKLVGHVPDSVLVELPDVIDKFEINTVNRLSHFLGQCSHESGGFRIIRENLNYSADGLLKIFPKYFTDSLHAKIYARQPEKIANRVYANRMGNGGPETGDGWKFRGRGYIQLTGRNNYSLFNGFVKENIIVEPDLVASKYPLLSASWFFTTNGIHRLCDAGVDRTTITTVTRRINGGTHGLDDRISRTINYFNLLK